MIGEYVEHFSSPIRLLLDRRSDTDENFTFKVISTETEDGRKVVLMIYTRPLYSSPPFDFVTWDSTSCNVDTPVVSANDTIMTVGSIDLVYSGSSWFATRVSLDRINDTYNSDNHAFWDELNTRVT